MNNLSYNNTDNLKQYRINKQYFNINLIKYSIKQNILIDVVTLN